jgi:hypothetical protein
VRIAVAEARGQFGSSEKGERLPATEIASHFLTANIIYKYDNSLRKFRRKTIFFSLQFVDMDLYFKYKRKVDVSAENVQESCALILEG